jgi:hypothetical protein
MSGTQLHGSRFGGEMCIFRQPPDSRFARGSMTRDTKDCFGILDEIFPKGKQGLREVPPACMMCPHKKECMQAALETREGIGLRSEVLERAEHKGLIGRLRRWSEKKALHRLMEGKEKRRS